MSDFGLNGTARLSLDDATFDAEVTRLGRMSREEVEGELRRAGIVPASELPARLRLLLVGVQDRESAGADVVSVKGGVPLRRSRGFANNLFSSSVWARTKNEIGFELLISLYLLSVTCGSAAIWGISEEVILAALVVEIFILVYGLMIKISIDNLRQHDLST